MLHAFLEGIPTNEVVEHPDDTCPLVVRYVVENLVHFRGMTHLYLYGVGVLQGVQFEGRNDGIGHELRPDVHVGKKVIGTSVLHEAGKTFIEPQMRPPFHSDEVTKPTNFVHITDVRKEESNLGIVLTIDEPFHGSRQLPRIVWYSWKCFVDQLKHKSPEK